MPKRTTVGGVEVDETEPLSIINIPIDWAGTWKLAKQARSLRFLQDKEGNIIGFPVITVDPNTNPKKMLGGPPGLIPETIPTHGYASAGGATNTMWTPATGKRFRVMSGYINVPAGTATAVGLTVTIQDISPANTRNIMVFFVSIGALVALGYPLYIPFTLPGNGYLGQSVGSEVKLTVTALTAGSVYANVYGSEE